MSQPVLFNTSTALGFEAHDVCYCLAIAKAFAIYVCSMAEASWISGGRSDKL
ncbi:hypothetical protein BVRB_8g192280 [Beta vulgaris subsp. vulgaris]|nr:hypothetical protein BVRB_8g192280 [Beta vulgaris subsp. vulgaris]